jgi:hypothetical protein
VHGFGEVGGGNVDVLSFAVGRVFGHDKTKAAGIGLQPADDEVHLLWQPEAVAADLQQLAAGHQRFQLSLE